MSQKKSDRRKSAPTEDGLPPLTSLQFAVLDEVGAGKITGSDLRDRLKGRGVRKTGPAFYQLMARLEDAKFVEGWYEENVIDGQRIRKRHYRLLGDAVRALRETQAFYGRSLTTSYA